MNDQISLKYFIRNKENKRNQIYKNKYYRHQLDNPNLPSEAIDLPGFPEVSIGLDISSPGVHKQSLDERVILWISES